MVHTLCHRQPFDGSLIKRGWIRTTNQIHVAIVKPFSARKTLKPPPRNRCVAERSKDSPNELPAKKSQRKRVRSLTESQRCSATTMKCQTFCNDESNCKCTNEAHAMTFPTTRSNWLRPRLSHVMSGHPTHDERASMPQLYIHNIVSMDTNRLYIFT